MKRSSEKIAVLIALIALIVALLNWLAPFSPVGPSPFAQNGGRPLATQAAVAIALLPTTTPRPTSTQTATSITAVSSNSLSPGATSKPAFSSAATQVIDTSITISTPTPTPTTVSRPTTSLTNPSTPIPTLVKPPPLFLEDFNDGDVTNNPGWTYLNSAFAVANGQLHSDGLNVDQSDRYRNIFNTSVGIHASDYLELSYDGMLKSVGDPQLGRGITSYIFNGNMGLGYDLNIQDGYTSGFSTNQHSLSLGYRHDSTLDDLIVTKFLPMHDRIYSIRAVRQQGTWTLYVGDVAVGSASDPLSLRDFDGFGLALTGSVVVDNLTVRNAP